MSLTINLNTPYPPGTVRFCKLCGHSENLRTMGCRFCKCECKFDAPRPALPPAFASLLEAFDPQVAADGSVTGWIER